MKSLKVMLVLVSILVAGAAFAADPDPAPAAQGEMEVEASVTAVCSISTTGKLDFGAYDATVETATTTSAQVVVICSRGSIPNLTMEGGETTVEREMLGPDTEENLAYSASVGNLDSDDTEHTFTINGSVGAFQYVEAGIYTDTIQIEINL